jgi:hypothetical protein
MSDRPTNPPPEEAGTDRREIWSRRIALGVMLAFATFVILNLVVVLALVYSSAIRGGGGPFGP